MDQFNISFREFDNGGNGIFINDKQNNFFEGVIMDTEKFEGVLEALDRIRKQIGVAALMQINDGNSDMTLSAYALTENEIIFSVCFRGERDTEKGILSTFFKGKTNLYSIASTPTGGDQFQEL